MPRHLYARLILVVSLFLCVAFAGYGWYTGYQQTQIYTQTMRQSAHLLAQSLAQGAAPYLLVEDYAGLDSYLLQAAVLPDLVRLQVCDPAGTLYSDVKREPGQQPASLPEPGRVVPPGGAASREVVDGPELILWYPVKAGSRLGWLKADFSLAATREMRGAIWESSILLALLWIAVSAVMVILVLQGPVKAIQHLSGFARDLVRNRGAQVTVADDTVEIRQLEASINLASRELLLKEQELINERERLAVTLASIGDGVIAVDTNGCVVLMNRAAADLTGWSPAEAMGQPLTEVLQVVREEDGMPVALPVTEVMASGKLIELAPNSLLISRDGSRRSIADSGAPIIDGTGATIGAVLVFRDVTERQRQEAQIRQLNAELEQRVEERTAQLEVALRELESFSYSVSHDLRAPLRHITGFSAALEEEYCDLLDDPGKDYLHRIVRAASRMGILIDDMLQLSRLVRAPMHRIPLDLSDMAREILQELRGAAPERQVQTVVAEGMTASGDPVLARAVLENLLGNAWKYTGKRELAVIEVGEAEVEGKSAFYVRDNGAGFDMAYADKLFQVFQRLHRDDEFEGTGIGLASVRRIVQRHGGQVWGDGAVEQGATFYFTLG